MFAPTLAIKVVIGINIKNAGIFINPILKGKLASKKEPEIKKPMAPTNAIINPIAEALPIAFLLDNQNILEQEHSLQPHQFPLRQKQNLIQNQLLFLIKD